MKRIITPIIGNEFYRRTLIKQKDNKIIMKLIKVTDQPKYIIGAAKLC